MNHEFKPGDLAIIKQCKTWPPAIGRCVELIQQMAPGADTVYDDQLYINGSSKIGWLVYHSAGFPRNSNLRGLVSDEFKPIALFGEHLLMPLRGDENPDATLATERPTELVSA